MSTSVSPFARSTGFETSLLAGREQTVSLCPLTLMTAVGSFLVQIEEMYSIPESFLEIEVRNPQTHGPFGLLVIHQQHFSLNPFSCRFRSQDVHGL